MGRVPKISHLRNKAGVQGRSTKVLVSCIFPGSTFKNQYDIAKGLSKEKDADGNPLFDVTVLSPKDNKKAKPGPNLHVKEFPILAKDIILNGKGLTPPEMVQMLSKAQD
jgi:hypothetical protein